VARTLFIIKKTINQFSELSPKKATVVAETSLMFSKYYGCL